MCGVFGYMAAPGELVDLTMLEQLATANERRGPHAWGVAWIDDKGHLHAFRKQGAITDSLDVLRKHLQAARAIIGHTRFTTRGSESQAINNHPHPVDGGWLVHNGTLPDYHTTIDRFGLLPSGECDSELIGLVIEGKEGTLPDRFAKAVRRLGKRPITVLGLWRSPDQLLAMRMGNPLQVLQRYSGTYLSSVGVGSGWASLAEGQLLRMRRRGAESVQVIGMKKEERYGLFKRS